MRFKRAGLLTKVVVMVLLIYMATALLDLHGQIQTIQVEREELRRLPDKYRTVLHLYYYEDMTTEEIARLLDRSPATVRSQLMRGRDRLRVLLEEG